MVNEVPVQGLAPSKQIATELAESCVPLPAVSLVNRLIDCDWFCGALVWSLVAVGGGGGETKGV